MRSTNDIQYFRVIGQMLENCKRWAEEVYKPKRDALAAFVQEEFGATQVEYSLDMHGYTYVSAVQLPGDGSRERPHGMKFVSAFGLMKPDKKTKVGKQYIEKFESLKLPPGASTVLDTLFGDADSVYWGNGYYRRAQFFQAGADNAWFFCCDVDQAIKMKLANHPDLVPLLPIEMKEIETETTISSEEASL